jgi:hypothetical protein
VKVVDLNVLLYATDSASAHHSTARPWLDLVMSSTETIGIPSLVAVGYVRLTTSRRVMTSPLDVPTAIDVVRGWFGRANVTMPAPTARHFDVLASLLHPVGTGGNLVYDAHLAALSIEHGAELCSYDHDMDRFAGVTWVSPAGH